MEMDGTIRIRNIIYYTENLNKFQNINGLHLKIPSTFNHFIGWEKVMDQGMIDDEERYQILSVEEVARFFQKSPSWVYKNWKELGGRKLGGSLFFPERRELYEHLFCKKKRLEMGLSPQRNQVHGSMVLNKKGSQAGITKKKGGNTQSTTNAGLYGDDPNRHGLLGAN